MEVEKKMDLEAYARIEELNHLLTDNGIEIPRLRGITLCTEQTPYTDEDIAREIISVESDAYTEAVQSDWRCCGWFEFSDRTEHNIKKYGIKVPCDEYPDFPFWKPNWDLIHGRKRKALKFILKKSRRHFERFVEVYNKYSGIPNVLRIHARLGSNNWTYFNCHWIEQQEWFIEKVDDYWDSTYCDIYIRIPVESNS